MGDKFVDVIVERVCLTVSVPFLATLGRFVFDSMPCDRRHEGGIVNHGYVGDGNSIEEQTQVIIIHKDGETLIEDNIIISDTGI